MRREEALNFPVSNGLCRKLLINAREWETIDELKKALMEDWYGTQQILFRVPGIGRKTINQLMDDLGVSQPEAPNNTAVFLTSDEIKVILSQLYLCGKMMPTPLIEKLEASLEKLTQ